MSQPTGRKDSPCLAQTVFSTQFFLEINDFHAEEAATKYDLSKKCHAPVAYNMDKICGNMPTTGSHAGTICMGLAATRVKF